MNTIIKTSSVHRTGPALLVTALLLASGASAGFAQYKDPNNPEQPALDTKKLPSLSFMESHFIKKATKDNDEDVRISQIAQQRASRPEVKEFARRLASENGNTNSELQALASRKGVELSSPAGNSLEKKWNGKEAKEFDTDYVKQMASDLESTVKLFEKRTDSNDPEIAAYAKKTLPILQEDLRVARDLLKGTQ